MKKRIWTHIVFDCFGCRIGFDELVPRDLQNDVIRLVREKGLSVVGEMLHEFPSPGAFTSAILLAESHVTIHTWPEERYVSIDIFVCNMSRDFSGDAEAIGEYAVGRFDPETTEKSILYR